VQSILFDSLLYREQVETQNSEMVIQSLCDMLVNDEGLVVAIDMYQRLYCYMMIAKLSHF